MTSNPRLSQCQTALKPLLNMDWNKARLNRNKTGQPCSRGMFRNHLLLNIQLNELSKNHYETSLWAA